MALGTAKTNRTELLLDIRSMGGVAAKKMMLSYNVILEKHGIILHKTAQKGIHFASAMTKMQMSNKQADLALRKTAQSLRLVKKRMDEAALSGGRLQRHFQKFRTVAVRVFQALTAFFIMYGLQRVVQGFSKAIVNSNAQLEMMNRQLLVLYKRASEVNKVMIFLKEYAITTPFRIEDLMKSTVVLRAFALDVVKYTKSVGDWASTIGQTAKETAVAFGKISIGTPRTALLLATRGLTKKEFDKFLGIYKDRAVALQKMIMAHFGGMAEATAKTFLGFLSNIADAWFLISARIGEGIFQVIRQDVEAVHNWMRKLLDNEKAMEKFKEPIAAIYIYLRNWVVVLSKIISLFGRLLIFLGKTKILGIVLTGVFTVFFAAFAKGMLLAIFRTQELGVALAGVKAMLLGSGWTIALLAIGMGIGYIITRWQRHKMQLQESLGLYEAIAEARKDTAAVIRLENERKALSEIQKVQIAVGNQYENFNSVVKERTGLEKKAYLALQIFPDIQNKMSKEFILTAHELLNYLAEAHKRQKGVVVELEKQAELNARQQEAGVAFLEAQKRVAAVLEYINVLMSERKAGMVGIDPAEAKKRGEQLLNFIEWYEEQDIKLTKKAVQEKFDILLEGLEIGSEEKRKVLEFLQKLDKETTQSLAKEIQRQIQLRQRYLSNEEAAIEKLAQHYYKTYQWTTDQYASFLQKRLAISEQYTAEELNLTEYQYELMIEKQQASIDALKGSARISDAIYLKTQKIGREFEKWRDVLVNDVYNILQSLIANLSTVYFTIAKTKEKLDEQLADERFRLEVLRGLRQEKTEEQQIQERIVELEKERANILVNEVKKALLSALKAVVAMAAKMWLQAVLARAITREVKKQQAAQVEVLATSVALLITEKLNLAVLKKKYETEKKILAVKIAQTIISAATGVPSPDVSGAVGGAKQYGMDSWVNKPTWFLAGEAGPERVTVSPGGEAEPRVIQILGPVYDWENFKNQVRQADIEIEMVK